MSCKQTTVTENFLVKSPLAHFLNTNYASFWREKSNCSYFALFSWINRQILVFFCFFSFTNYAAFTYPIVCFEYPEQLFFLESTNKVFSRTCGNQTAINWEKSGSQFTSKWREEKFYKNNKFDDAMATRFFTLFGRGTRKAVCCH